MGSFVLFCFRTFQSLTPFIYFTHKPRLVIFLITEGLCNTSILFMTSFLKPASFRYILLYFSPILLHMVAPSLTKTYIVPLSRILSQRSLNLGDIKDRYTILRPQVYCLQLILIAELLKHHLLPFCLKIGESSVRLKRTYTYNLAKEPNC